LRRENIGEAWGEKAKRFFWLRIADQGEGYTEPREKKPDKPLDEDPIVRFALNGLLFVSSVGCSLRRSKCQARRGKLIIPALSSF